jgi:hypothetical protein
MTALKVENSAEVSSCLLKFVHGHIHDNFAQKGIIKIEIQAST